jgi:leader peptidase (prepilin peptidase) / N-methyltransferase
MQDYLDLYMAVMSFLIGAVVGSFLNVVIVRLPLGLSIVSPPSRCPHCGHSIRYYDNIPILGFLLLRGRCRDCGESIARRYPLIEATTALLALGLYEKFGFAPVTGAYFVLCAALVAVFWIDWDHMIIPDVISLNGIAVGVLFAIANVLPGVIWSSSIMGALLGAFILYAPAALYEKLRGVEGLGRGDIKLLAMIGAFTGPAGVVFVLFFSSFAGCVVALIGITWQGRSSSTPMPFGPFLAVSAILFVFQGEELIESFFRLSHLLWGPSSPIG